jgi:hypothetical protein
MRRSVGTLCELGTVRNQHERPSLSQHVDRVGDDRGALRIQIGRGLVEQHQWRVAQERARERYASPLSRREGTSSVADHCLVSVGKRVDEVVRAGESCGGADLLVGRSRRSEPDVFRDGPRKTSAVARGGRRRHAFGSMPARSYRRRESGRTTARRNA